MVYLAIESTDPDSTEVKLFSVDLSQRSLATSEKDSRYGFTYLRFKNTVLSIHIFSESRPDGIIYEFDTTIVPEEESLSDTDSVISSTDTESIWSAVSDASSAPSEIGRPPLYSDVDARELPRHSQIIESIDLRIEALNFRIEEIKKQIDNITPTVREKDDPGPHQLKLDFQMSLIKKDTLIKKEKPLTAEPSSSIGIPNTGDNPPTNSTSHPNQSSTMESVTSTISSSSTNPPLNEDQSPTTDPPPPMQSTTTSHAPPTNQDASTNSTSTKPSPKNRLPPAAPLTTLHAQITSQILLKNYSIYVITDTLPDGSIYFTTAWNDLGKEKTRVAESRKMLKTRRARDLELGTLWWGGSRMGRSVLKEVFWGRRAWWAIGRDVVGVLGGCMLGR